PAKTPRAIVARLATELDNVTNEREVRAQLMAAGLTPVRDSPEAFATAIRSESVQWQGILRQAGPRAGPLTKHGAAPLSRRRHTDVTDCCRVCNGEITTRHGDR